MAREFESQTRGRLPCAFACLLLATLCAGPVRAQEGTQTQAAGEPAARKVSEYVNQFTSCNAGAHLDNLAIELQNEPAAQAYVVIYGPGGKDDRYAERAVGATKNYLVSVRGLDEGRVEVVHGGVYRNKAELLTELWLVPEGAKRPPPVEYTNDAATFEGKFADFETWDDNYIGFAEVEGWSSRGEVTSVGLAEVLRRRAGTRAYIVAFNGGETAPGAWRRVAERERERLKSQGVAEDRVRVIFGGYRKQPRAQLWVLPADAPPPAADAGRERGPKEAMQLGTFEQYALRYPEEARKAFRHLADVLRADESLTASVFVRLGLPGETPAPPDPDDPPDVDLVRLVEKWKADLKKEFGVGDERLTVIVVAPDEDSPSSGSIEAWVVPPGVAQPNPFAPAEEVVEEEGRAEAEEAQTKEPGTDEEAEEEATEEAEPAEEEAAEPPDGRHLK